MIAFLRELPDYPADFFVNKKSKTNLENSADMLREAVSALEALPEWSMDGIHDALMELAQRLDRKSVV